MVCETNLAGAINHKHFMVSQCVASTIINIVVCCSQTIHETGVLNAHRPGHRSILYAYVGFSEKYLFNFPLVLQNKKKNKTKKWALFKISEKS